MQRPSFYNQSEWASLKYDDKGGSDPEKYFKVDKKELFTIHDEESQ